MVDFVLNAELRDDKGKGASRRLRRTGKVPAIMYGTDKEPTSISLNHNELVHQTSQEAFFSHILTVKLDGNDESAIIKDMLPFIVALLLALAFITFNPDFVLFVPRLLGYRG